MSLTPRKKRKLLIILVAFAVLGGYIAWFAWDKFFREEPEQQFVNDAERFKYGSIGAEADRGIPYWIWIVLPRIFPDLMPGPGGYRSFGLVWEEGKELPVGFTKRVIGFPRVANNCAICHTGTWRSKPDETPHVVATAPSHTADVQGLLRFFINVGKDPRFNADTVLAEIDQVTKLSFVDRQIYRYLIIPFTRRALRQQESQLAWMNRHGWPPWGKGRDDPMNLTKYFMTSMPVDNTTGQADFPSVWNLKARKGEGLFLNWSCDTPAVRSVLIDSALGLGARPNDWFLHRMEQLDDFLSAWPAPKYPFPIDENLAKAGAPIYARLCAECHDPGAPRTNRLIPIAEIKTDRERMDTWTQAAADEANQRVKELGINRPNMVKQEGYQAPPLDGVWLRAPYLHNGSVPNLREVLEPEEKRTKVFYRGYDVYDPVNVGFVISGAEAERHGWKLDVSERGNGNLGHNYGATLAPDEKRALLEYLKKL
jgi:processive rubber oxygenase RoxA-like protein